MTIQKTKPALIPETVWLSSNALDALDDFGLRTGLETGAWLFGHRFDDAVEVHVIDGWTRGDEDCVSLHRDIKLERSYAKDGLTLVGDMHTHPYWTDESANDERGWTQLARDLGRPIVGLIVGGNPDQSSFPFADPLFAAWIAGPNRIRRVSVTKEADASLWPPRLRPLLPLIDEQDCY
jgi:hypothetical protein